MVRGFLVVGPENSGTKMLTECLVSVGVLGSFADEQPFDAGLPTSPDLPCVLRRSVPYGDDPWPDLQELIDRFRALEYRPVIWAIHRKTDFLFAGQMLRGYVRDIQQADRRYEVFWLWLSGAPSDVPVNLIPYEVFVTYPAFRERLFMAHGLPAPKVSLFNRNVGRSYSGVTALAW